MIEFFTKACLCLGKCADVYNADVHFVTTEEIQKLNKKWRKVDAPTDVLSFPINELNPATKKFELGDIVICREFMGDLSEEYLYLHGLLHLFGYTHDTDEDEARMNAIIKGILGERR